MISFEASSAPRTMAAQAMATAQVRSAAPKAISSRVEIRGAA
jgi:hypothetical protein